MTNHFPEAFKRFPEEYRRFKSFKDLVAYFKEKGGKRAPMTDKQTRALGVEAKRMGMKPIRQINFSVKGKRLTRWRDVTNGRFVKGE